MNRFPNEVRLPPCRQAPRHQTSVPLSGKAVHTCGKRIAAGTKRHPISQIMSQGMRVLFWTHRRSGKVRVQGGATIFTASSPRDDGTPVCSLKACKVDDASPFLFCCPPSLLLPVCTRTHTHTPHRGLLWVPGCPSIQSLHVDLLHSDPSWTNIAHSSNQVHAAVSIQQPLR